VLVEISSPSRAALTPELSTLIQRIQVASFLLPYPRNVSSAAIALRFPFLSWLVFSPCFRIMESIWMGFCHAPAVSICCCAYVFFCSLCTWLRVPWAHSLKSTLFSDDVLFFFDAYLGKYTRLGSQSLRFFLPGAPVKSPVRWPGQLWCFPFPLRGQFGFFPPAGQCVMEISPPLPRPETGCFPPVPSVG